MRLGGWRHRGGGAGWAVVALAVAVGSWGCRRHGARPRRGTAPPASASIEVRDAVGARDPRTEARARDVDARLGGACPRRLARPPQASLGGVALDGALAKTCLDHALHRAGIRAESAEPWRSALVELVALPPDGPVAGARRALARELVARGGGGETLGLANTRPDATTPDPRATAALAFAFVESLATRPGVGASGALGFAISAARRGPAVALISIGTDAETFLSTTRATLLARAAPSGPQVTDARWSERSGVALTFDRTLLDGQRVDGRACDRPFSVVADGSAQLVVALARADCPIVDGATAVTVSLGEAPWGAPAAADDGALGRPAHARVVVP